VLKLLRTTSFRLTVRYALLFAASVALLGAAIYFEVARFATEQQDEVIEHEIEAIERASRGLDASGIAMLVMAHVAQPPAPAVRYRLFDAQGRVLAGTLPLDRPRAKAFWFEGPRADKPRKTGRIRARGERLHDGLLLVVAQDGEVQEELEDLREVIARDFGYGLAFTVLLAIAGGMVMSAGALRRVEAVNRTTREIVGSNLSRRLPVRGTGDELDRLSESVNGMLARIEAQVDAMRQVSADIAHDLRTPLTRLRIQIESALQLEDPARLREALNRLLGEVDGLLATFTALLRIAQLEAADRSAPHASFDLSEVLSTLAEVYQPTVDGKSQTLRTEIEPGLAVAGDRDLLAQLFANLLDNASHHSPQGARIELAARRVGPNVEVIVADNGPGIPVEEHDKVFRRMYRLERSRTTPGSGLGLALVAAIAGMHKARITLADNRPGLRVQVVMHSAAS
jgi:signal transduction histidine kinase